MGAKNRTNPNARQRGWQELCRRGSDIRAKAQGHELGGGNERPRAGSNCEASERQACGLRGSDALECKNPWLTCA